MKVWLLILKCVLFVVSREDQTKVGSGLTSHWDMTQHLHHSFFSYKPGSDEKTFRFLWTVFIAEDFWVNWLIVFVCYPSPVFKTVWLPFNHVTNRAKTVNNWFVLSSGLVCPGRRSRNVVKSDPLWIISDMTVSQINCKWMVRCIICSTVSMK